MAFCKKNFVEGERKMSTSRCFNRDFFLARGVESVHVQFA